MPVRQQHHPLHATELKPQTVPQRPFVIGLNARTGGAVLRERLTLEENECPQVLDGFAQAGLTDLFLLITCDRVEIFGVAASDPQNTARKALKILANHAAIAPEDVLSAASFRSDQDALRHLFAVAAALDSTIVGEPQILGQVKQAHRLAAEKGLCGTALHSWLDAAYQTAKQIRHDTSLGEGAVNIATVAVELAGDLHGRLKRRKGCLLGTGEMGELLADRFLRAGLAQLHVYHRREKRAAAVAERLSCHYGALQSPASSDGSVDQALVACLADHDVVLAALGDGRCQVTAKVVEDALRRRRRKPILLVDTSVPADIDIDVAKLDGAFLYSLDDLEALAAHGRAGREQASREAWALLEAALERYDRQKASRAAVPAIIALRQHFENLRAEILEGYAEDGEAAKATRSLVQRLLHHPSLVLADLAVEGQGADSAALLGRLWDCKTLLDLAEKAPTKTDNETAIIDEIKTEGDKG